MNRLHFTPLLSLLLALLFSLHAASCAADETDFYTEIPPLLRFTQQTQQETVAEDIHILRTYPDTANDRIDEEMRALIDSMTQAHRSRPHLSGRRSGHLPQRRKRTELSDAGRALAQHGTSERGF